MKKYIYWSSNCLKLNHIIYLSIFINLIVIHFKISLQLNHWLVTESSSSVNVSRTNQVTYIKEFCNIAQNPTNNSSGLGELTYGATNLETFTRSEMEKGSYQANGNSKELFTKSMSKPDPGKTVKLSKDSRLSSTTDPFMLLVWIWMTHEMFKSSKFQMENLFETWTCLLLGMSTWWSLSEMTVKSWDELGTISWTISLINLILDSPWILPKFTKLDYISMNTFCQGWEAVSWSLKVCPAFVICSSNSLSFLRHPIWKNTMMKSWRNTIWACNKHRIIVFCSNIFYG